MKIKVQCPCGTRFEFEVEPVHERMPVSINCPVCNADATELANAVIQQQLTAPRPAAPVVGITAAPVLPPAAAAPPPPPTPPPQSGLRIAKSPSVHTAPAPAPTPVAPANAAAPADSTVQLCPKHPGEPAVDTCVVCGKPVCLKCMEQFGHVCSVYCRQQATQRRIYVPAYAQQKSVMAEKANLKARFLSLGIAFLVFTFLGLWFWYAWFARDPKVVYSLPIAQTMSASGFVIQPQMFFKLIAPNQLFSVKNKQATLLDITQNKELWSTPLQTDSEPAASKKSRDKKDTAHTDPSDFASEEDYNLSFPLVAVTTNDLWLSFGDRLVRLDRQTGARKENPVSGRILSFSHDDAAILVVSVSPAGQPSLTRISLPDGNLQTTNILTGPGEVKPAVKILAGKKLLNTNTSPAAMASTDAKMKQIRAATAATGRGLHSIITPDAGAITDSRVPADYLEELSSFAINGQEVPPFTLAGQTVVQFKARLLEQKSVTRQAMKAKGKPVLEGTVTASQGLDLAQEMMNDSQRDLTGGVETEDVSRYQVTLHRWFANNIPDWTGEVIGPPKFYASKTIDLIAAGQTLIAFSKDNKKLWEAKLTYSLQEVGNRVPFLETKDALYFADPGILTCFDLATGTARWRLNSVGISSIQAGARGNLFITTTTAGPEKIKYSQQHNIHEKIYPVILKVDPATGKVLWRLESVGDACLISGKFLYCTRVSQSQSALKLEEGPDTHYNLDLLNPSNGNTIWNHHVRNHLILKTEVQQNWILLQSEDKLQVLKFFSL